jgi:hypothetical protein
VIVIKMTAPYRFDDAATRRSSHEPNDDEWMLANANVSH